MTSRRSRGLSFLLWLIAATTRSIHAADTPKPGGGTVELPPMMVEESVSSVPWLYVEAGGIEFLSRCSASTTRDLVEGWLTKMQMVRVLVPEEFLARLDVPTVFILYSQDLQQTVSAEIQRELKANSSARNDPRGDGVNIAPSMRLSDRDMHASIAYIDETLFDASTMSISPNHVLYLLRGRAPELPTWVVDGLDRTYRRGDFVLAPITLGPLVWINSSESEAIASDAARPRAILPAPELFASETVRLRENRHARRAEVRSSTHELFARWALISGKQMHDAYRKFAARAAEGPVSEELFEELFGFGYSELRDRLSDYLPRAVKEHKRFPPGKLPPLPPIEIEPATPNQIARVRGEWERLAISHVQRRLPQVREPYIAQARRTLRRAFDAGDRDPRLLATLGLCEIDAGNEAGARQFLEPAVAAGVVRPRAYCELARLRFAELRRGAPTNTLTYTALAPVLNSLRKAITQSPPLPEVFELLGEAWARCETGPNTAEFSELMRGAQLYARRPNVAFPIALALSRHGKKSEALATLDGCAGYAADDETELAMKRLRAELKSSAANNAGGGGDLSAAAGR